MRGLKFDLNLSSGCRTTGFLEPREVTEKGRRAANR